jgi:hypothetical protein
MGTAAGGGVVVVVVVDGAGGFVVDVVEEEVEGVAALVVEGADAVVDRAAVVVEEVLLDAAARATLPDGHAARSASALVAAARTAARQRPLGYNPIVVEHGTPWLAAGARQQQLVAG